MGRDLTPGATKRAMQGMRGEFSWIESEFSRFQSRGGGNCFKWNIPSTQNMVLRPIDVVGDDQPIERADVLDDQA